MFQNLQERLDGAIKTLKGQGKITEVNVASTIKEIRRALVDADVNYKIAKEFTAKVKDDAMGQDVMTAVSPGQLMIKIVKDNLQELMGGTAAEFELKGSPAVVLMAGLQGSGKTTFTAKLGKFMKENHKKSPLLVACDVYRPAAVDQLKVVGEQIGCAVYAEPGVTDPVGIAQRGIEEARKTGKNLVIVDTAGRLAVDEDMMVEIANIKSAINPDQILFVVDSMTGQDAVNTAKAFNDRLDFDGVVLTKLDGDTRGGAALSIKYIVDKPIKFISTGEKLDKIDVFHPDRMAGRILGMGDVISLVERAQQQYDEDEAKRLQAKMRKNQFDFDDFLAQLAQIRKMGSIKDLLGMIPGMGKALKGVDIDDNAFKGIEAMIQSMTPHERANPKAMTSSRRQRIAKGSGSTIQQVNQFMKQFEEMRKMMKNMGMMGKGGKKRMMPKMPFKR